ncbi:MAG: hypothetical protein LBG98_03335 [Puniceicoccales bacterium]|nr:hypothetical protein [Puniceicoccales bacterium]
MPIEGLSQGWKAGLEDANFGASAVRDIQDGNPGKVIENAANIAGNVIRGGLWRLGAEACEAASNALSAVGFNSMAQDAEQAGHRLQAARYEGKAESDIQKAGSHFKRAWTAAFRAHDNSKIKGVGAHLAFSVASWGTNMKEGLKNLGCAIGNGFMSLKEHIQGQL